MMRGLLAGKSVVAALLVAVLPAAALQAQDTLCPAEAPLGVMIPAPLLATYDFSLADTPNKRTALAYLYTAWNEARLREARLAYWRAGSFPELEAGGAPDGPPSGPPGPSPKYTIRQVIEEGNQVVVLAFVEGVGIGSRITTVFGTDGGTKIGDGVVELFRFDETGLIASKVDIVEPVSEASYDF